MFFNLFLEEAGLRVETTLNPYCGVVLCIFYVKITIALELARIIIYIYKY